MRMLLTSFLLPHSLPESFWASRGPWIWYGFLLFAAAAMAFIQYFFSDKLVLWSTGTRIVGEDEYPELHRSD